MSGAEAAVVCRTGPRGAGTASSRRSSQCPAQRPDGRRVPAEPRALPYALPVRSVAQPHPRAIASQRTRLTIEPSAATEGDPAEAALLQGATAATWPSVSLPLFAQRPQREHPLARHGRRPASRGEHPEAGRPAQQFDDQVGASLQQVLEPGENQQELAPGEIRGQDLAWQLGAVVRQPERRHESVAANSGSRTGAGSTRHTPSADRPAARRQTRGAPPRPHPRP
ncbi:hypothetical protein [Streptomyces sp. AC555_RSS877]|uniref:hypothetical protein n=1 Tax=Streptomyces sp. AC555_RSS877 TaxID=2823688 RepID=UPI001C25BF73|nr:hypothetical protein [Streptomyces sp. AC555_RSS877]